MQKIAIIVPCYNEHRRLKVADFNDFLLSHSHVSIIFVNDGSKDETLQLLESIKDKHPLQVDIIKQEKNGGKASAIRAGLISATGNTSFTSIGYLDADLSTTPGEFLSLQEKMADENLDFVLGSRVKLMQTIIRRSFFRHIIGRFIATLIDWKFHLGVYDTQCGAKWFKREIISELTGNPFHTKWFFDVELLLRMRKTFPLAKGMEIPLSHWADPGKSKLSFFKFPSVIMDMFSLMRNYRSLK